MKNLTNILQTQGMQARHNMSVANAETRALENVGKLAVNNPDIAALIGDENVDFKALLENMGHEEAQALIEKVNSGVDALEMNQNVLKTQLQEELGQQPLIQTANMTGQDARNLSQLNESTELTNVLNSVSNQNTDVQNVEANGASFNQPTKPKTLDAILGKNTKLTQSGQEVIDTSKMKQAEESTRAFIPERKSIFDIANKQSAATNKSNLNSQNGLIQSSNDMVNLNQFMQGQSTSAKNRMMAQNYKNEQASMFAPKIEMANLDGLKSNQVVQANSNEQMSEFNMSGEENHEMKSDSNVEFLSPNNLKTPSTILGGAKVFDMNSLQNANNTQDVINQIQNYIIQSKASNEQSVQMTFNHHELGNIDLQVMKSGGDKINIMINAQSVEGAKFFQQNQGELLQTLHNAGVQVAEFKLDSSAQSNNNSNSNQDSSKQFADQGRSNQQHEQNKRDNDSARRSQLWEEFKERETA